MRILFYDTGSPASYTPQTWLETGVGGTESALMRVAHGLASLHTVYIAQQNLHVDNEIQGVHYVTTDTAHQLTSIDVVIVLRDCKDPAMLANLFKKARFFLWMHNLPARDLYKQASLLAQYHFQIIAVSDYHARTIRERLQGKWYQRFCFSRTALVPVHRIYNSIADHLVPDATAIQSDKFLFMSSPQKGLALTISIFKRLREYFPTLQLYVANPGHREISMNFPEGVIPLGVLNQRDMVKHLRTSFCVFYPQWIRVETFGLIYAEANAVGTPVLAHHFGAASEILNDSDQLINGKNFTQILHKITAWRQQRPIVKGNPLFNLPLVLRDWQMLIDSSFKNIKNN